MLLVEKILGIQYVYSGERVQLLEAGWCCGVQRRADPRWGPLCFFPLFIYLFFYNSALLVLRALLSLNL